MQRDYQFSTTVLTIHLSDGANTIPINYRLYEHSVTNKWIRIMTKSRAIGALPREGGSFYGRGFLDYQKTKDALDRNVDIHNEYCRSKGLNDCIIPIKTDNPLTRECLNRLHDFFEIHVEDKRFWEDQQVGMNLEEINYNIHKLESALIDDNESCHVDIQFEPLMKFPLEDNDYVHFSPKFGWGELFLTYGTIGVPTLNAFWANSEPTPQRVIPNGMMMAFWGEVTNDHLKPDEWLKTKGMVPGDPKNALGFIPLGVLENVDQLNQKEVIKKISTHAKVVGISFSELKEKPPVKSPEKSQIDPSQEAQWPWKPEVLYHLDHTPYLDLKIEFDPKPLLEEAQRAINYFVLHRDYDQTGRDAGKWKSLALRGLFGDYTKTGYHTSYKFEGTPVYKETAFAQLCPETMKFLSTITDLSKCERVRYMLLEPGASIRVHRDSEDRDVCFAVNISLNMPEGCTFWSHLNPDGTENEFTVKLPFKDSGSVLLFNNAKYHKVVNNSSVPRIHIIFHGPIKFSDEQLVKLAREQNQITDIQELIRKVVRKKAILGESFEKTKDLFADWITTGLRDNSIPENFSLVVYDHEKYAEGETSKKHLRMRTEPSLFPLKYDVIKENEWDEFLKKAYTQGKEFVVLMAAGSYVVNLHSFIKQVFYSAQLLRKKKISASGHIVDGKFHEQFLIVNLRAWHDLGEVPLGQLENFGSSLIKRAFESDREVLPLSEELSAEKRYAFPRENNHNAKAEIEKIVSDRLNFSSNDVYYFNNELLTILNVPDLKPNRLISVAAGFKPFQIIRQFNMETNTKVNFTDFSRNSLDHIKSVVKAKDYDDLLDIMYSSMNKSSHKKTERDKIDAQLEASIRSYFGSKEGLIDAISKAKDATFQEVNLVQKPDELSKLIDKDDRFVVWISNAFYNNSLYLLFTPEECEERVLDVVKAIAKKTNTKAFRHSYQNSQTFVFGESIKSIKGLLTDGAAQSIQFDESSWVEVRR